MALSFLSWSSDVSFLSGMATHDKLRIPPEAAPRLSSCPFKGRSTCCIAPSKREFGFPSSHIAHQRRGSSLDSPWGAAQVTFAMAPQPESARGGETEGPLRPLTDPSDDTFLAPRESSSLSGIPGGRGIPSRSFLDASACAKQCTLMQTDPNEAQASQMPQCSGSSQEGEAHCSACLRGWAVAAAFVKNDAAIMKRGLLSWDSRARLDVERLRTGVSYLDARARADAGRLDSSARQRLRRLRSYALGVEEAARMEVIQVAQQHRDASGALMADLEIADLRARRRALEDAFTAWQLAKGVHDSLVRLLRAFDAETAGGQQGNEGESASVGRAAGMPFKTDAEPSSSVARALRTLKELSMDPNFVAPPARLDAGRGGDAITSSEELEFLLAALLDLDEVSEGSGALLLAQQLDSPDVATRKAIVDVLAAAPSLWALGNAGMGALQRLSKDEDTDVARAAERALADLWEDFTRQDG